LLLKTLMGPGGVVVSKVFLEYTQEMMLPKNQQVVKTLLPHGAHGTADHFITQLEQLALDPVKTHARVFASQTDNQIFEFRLDPRASTDGMSVECPFPAEEVPMPF
jgi:hypothetical protein